MGVIIGVGIFVTLIKYFNLLKEYKLIFTLAGSLAIIFSFLTPFMIIEPPDLEKKKKKNYENKNDSKCKKGCTTFKNLMTLNYRAYKENK